MVVLLLPRADASGASRLAVARPSLRVILVVVMLASASLFLLEAALARSRPPPASQYSLWLEPDDAAARARLAALIRTLAKRFGAPPFAPHVTLLGGLPGGPVGRARALERARALAASLAPFEIEARAVRVAATWNQAVLVEVERSDALVAAHVAARGAFLGDATERFAPPVGVPHLSLLYGAHDAAARDAAAAAAREQLAGGVRSSVGALQLWATGGGLSGVRGWHRVATFPLEGGSR